MFYTDDENVAVPEPETEENQEAGDAEDGA